MLNLISFVNFGIYGLMALLAREVLNIFYGPSYVEAFYILQILCIWGGLSAVGSAVSTIVIFRGRTDIGFTRTLLKGLIQPLFILAGSYFGLLGIVIGQAVYSVTFFVFNWRLLIWKIMRNISFAEYFYNIMPLMVKSITVATVLYILKEILLLKYSHVWINVIVLSGVFGLFYLLINKRNSKAIFDLAKKIK
jgi:O-antigen/teichoic acid export membrane protein